MEVKVSRKAVVICLFIFRRNKTRIFRRKSDKNYEAKHAMFVYFCYFAMETEKFVVAIAKQ